MAIDDGRYRGAVPRLVLRLRNGKHDEFATREIKPGEQFDIGRDDIKTSFGCDSKTVSKHHFRIHCIVYDEDDNSIPPMVYMQVLSKNGLLLCHEQDTRIGNQYLTRSDGARLLNSGDTYRLSSRVFVTFYRAVEPTSQTSLDAGQQSELLCETDQYRLTGHVIGSGAYARVVTAIQNSDGSQLACKVVPMGTTNRHMPQSRWQDMVQREIHILQVIDHPNIAVVKKVLFTPTNTYIFQELATGGDLMSYQQSRGVLPESEVLCIIYQLAQAVHYLHNIGIVHRDIKPENILLSSWQSGARIMLADFGQARFVQRLESAVCDTRNSLRMMSIAGTEGWQAPELRPNEAQKLNYGKAVDIWSLGGVAFACLTGNRPPDLVSHNVVCRATEHQPEWQHQIWLHLQRCETPVSSRAISFVQACLAIDEIERLNAGGALNHPWFIYPGYCTELSLAYARAIADWTPRLPSDHLVEHCIDWQLCSSGTPEPRTRTASCVALHESTLAAHLEPSSIMDYVPPRSTQMSAPQISQFPDSMLEFARTGQI